jgi:hypothetical protein
MPRTIIWLMLALWAGMPATTNKYSGPKCLGPFCVDSAVPTRTLFNQLGAPAARVSPVFPYCYQSQDGTTFLYIDTQGSEPGVSGAVFVSDFRNCIHMKIQVTSGGLNAWKTPEGVKIGSSEDDVIKAYGKPSSEDKVNSQTYRFAIRGYRPTDKVPMIANKMLLYNDLTGDSLNAAEFGIRSGKVSFIWLSRNE